MSVLCVGQIVADVVVRPVDHLPSPGTADLVDSLDLAAGGCAANTACVLAKLGAKTRLAGAVGNDGLGEAALGRISACGVDVSGVARLADVPTSACTVLVASNGERSFFYRNGANERLYWELVEGCLAARPDFVHVGGAMKLLELNLKKLLSAARSPGCRTSLDTDWDPRGLWMKTLGDVLPHVDYLLTNQEEGQCLTGETEPVKIGKSLLARGPQAVVVKRGEKGAWLVTGSMDRAFGAMKVNVVDTTCAGDSFAAGFLAGLAEGWPLERAVLLGNAAGALCTTQLSHYGVVSKEETLEFMK
jgi:sugar/nucleoside kinase (ribokinase family)